MDQGQEILRKLDELQRLINEKHRDSVQGWNLLNDKINKIAKHLGMDINEFLK
jgi:hypothetical protein